MFCVIKYFAEYFAEAAFELIYKQMDLKNGGTSYANFNRTKETDKLFKGGYNKMNFANLRKGKSFISVLLVIMMVFTFMPMTANAAASNTVAIQVVDKSGTAQTLETWSYNDVSQTYTADGVELPIVNSFTDTSQYPLGGLAYTGINSDSTDPRCLAVCTKGILMEDAISRTQTLADSTAGFDNIDLRGNTSIAFWSGTFAAKATYADYWGLSRYYYPDWYGDTSYSAITTGTAVSVPSVLQITGNYYANKDNGYQGTTLPTLLSSVSTTDALRDFAGQQSGGSSTDRNLGKMSAKPIDKIVFSPEYNTISVTGGTSTGAVGTDLKYATGEAQFATADNYFTAAKGEAVTLTVTPQSGYQIKSVTVTDGSSNKVAVTAGANNKYSFTMPASAVTVSAGTKALTGGVWDGASVDTSWYNASSAAMTISSPAQLAGLAAIVNGTVEGIAKDDFAGRTVTMSSDIALDADNMYTSASGTFGVASYAQTSTYYTVDPAANIWTPIGSGAATGNDVYSSRNYFAGTFNGSGHTVSGLYTNVSSTVQGLFGCVSGTIKNVKVSGLVSAKIVAGGIAAYLNGGTIDNCTNSAIVYADGGEKAGTGTENGISGGGAVGGIVGNAAGTGFSITNCVNNGIITCTNTSKGGRAGGILGLVNTAAYTGSVSNCINNAQVESYQYTGGIAGSNYSTNNPISSCVNTAKIICHSPGSAYAGGIVATSSSNITNCYNTGNFTIQMDGSYGTKGAHLGGIISDLGGSAVITNCYDTGNLQFSGYAGSCSSVGVICGSGGSAAKLVNCYYLTTAAITYGKADVEQNWFTSAAGLTADQMKAADFATTLSGTGRAFVTDTPAVNSGYPILRWQAGADTATVTSVTKSADPTKTSYFAGDLFSAAGLVLWANCSDGTKEIITNYTISKTTALATADTAVTVSGTYKNYPYSFTLPITVAAKAAAPVFSLQPAGAGYLLNATTSALTLAASVTDGGIVSYQWYCSTTNSNTAGVAITSATGTSYTPATTTLGSFYYYCIAKNTLGSATATATSAIAAVNVTKTGDAALSIWDGTVDVSWYNTTDKTFTLSTPAQLAGLAAIVNGIVLNNASVVGNANYITNNTVTIDGTIAHYGYDDFDGKTIKLAANLDMGGVYDSNANTWSGPNYAPIGGQWLTPDGSIAMGASFCGSFDGQGHTVSNIYCPMLTGMSSQSVGLIGRLGIHDNDVANGYNTLPTITPTVKNVAVTGYIRGGRSVGGIVGKIGKTDLTKGSPTIENCANFATISNSDSKGCGGIVGAGWNGGTVKNCYNAGTVACGYTKDCGGISGANESAIINCYNVGNITLGGKQTGTAAIASHAAGSYTNCYWLVTSAAIGVYNVPSSQASQVISKTADQMKTAAFVAALNANGGYAFVQDTNKINNGYPVLAWQATQTIPPVLVKDSAVSFTNLGQKAVEITFADSAAWRTSITAITINGTAITNYSVTAGKITFPVGDIVAPGDYTIIVSATGYTDASVIQSINSVFISSGITGGTVTTNTSNAVKGNTVTVTATPNSGKQLLTAAPVTIAHYDGTTGTALTVSTVSTSTGICVYSFVMPAYAVSVSATFSPYFTTAAVADSATYTSATSDGALLFTVNTGIAGMKYFKLTAQHVLNTHSGNETVIFAQYRGGVLQSLNATVADFDTVTTAQAGFNVQAGDVIKAYVVDALTNSTTTNPVVLQ